MKSQTILAVTAAAAALFFSIAPSAQASCTCTVSSPQFIDPTTSGWNSSGYQAMCNGSTDDTNAFACAIQCAGSGGGLHIPVGKLCNVTSLTLSGQQGFTISSDAQPSPPSASGGPTGIQFTGTPTTCAQSGGVGTGGLINTGGFLSDLLIQSVGLYENPSTATSSTGTCFLNIYEASRVRLVQNYISVNPKQVPDSIALRLEEDTQVEVRQNYFDDNGPANCDTNNPPSDLCVGVFGKHVFASSDTGNYVEGLIIKANRFGQLAFPYRYNPEVDIEVVSSGGSLGGKALDVADNIFEVGPNLLYISDGLDVGVDNNWTGDGATLTEWSASQAITASEGSPACVSPTTYISSGPVNIFCTRAGGTTGSSEPTWSTSCPSGGQTCNDNGITWTNEGPGILFNLTMTGTLSGNQVGGNAGIGIRLNSNSATGQDSYGTTSVSGNNFFGDLWIDLLDLATGSSLRSNTFSASSSGSYSAMAALLQVGNGTISVPNVLIGVNKYTSSGAFVVLSANTHGTLTYDTSQYSSSNLTDNSSGGWVISDPGGTVSVVPSFHIDIVKLYSNLPACNSAAEGKIQPIGDSTTTTWGASISGGGSHHVLAYCDGTTWTVFAQ
jgi:hypothetical protein